MAEISQILDIEQQNIDCIHLFRVGLFYRAYQKSAYLFQTRVRDFKAVRKYTKATRCDVAMLGFPSKLLDSMFQPGTFEVPNEGHVVIQVSEPLDIKAYQQWFSVVPYAEVKKKAAVDPVAPESSSGTGKELSISFDETVMQPSSARDRVLSQLETFSIESATPLDCMMFLSRLKSELKAGRG